MNVKCARDANTGTGWSARESNPLRTPPLLAATARRRTPGYSCRSIGSSRSRIQSPRKLNAKDTKKIARPGNSAIQ